MKWGTRVTAVAAATVVAGAATAATADAAGPPVYSKYSVGGSTHIAKADVYLNLGPGQFEVYTLIGPYSFTGTFTLPPVPVTRSVPGVGRIDGTVTFGPGHAEGSMFGGFSGSATWPVTLSDVHVNGMPYDVGAKCGTKEPVTTALASDDFATGRGGRLESTYAIGAFENCGSATPLINAFVPGPGNTLALDLAGQSARRPARTRSMNSRDDRSPRISSVWWISTRPMSAMSPTSTFTTPSGSRRCAAISATDRVSRHRSQIRRCSTERTPR